MPAETSRPDFEPEPVATGEPGVEEASTEPAGTGPIDIPPGQTAHFPQHTPRLTQGGQRVFNALRPKR